MEQQLSSAEIASKIAFAHDALKVARLTEADLALPAVSGDVEAALRIADARQEIRQMEGDLSLLTRAQEAARAREIDEAAARDDAYRARHLDIARQKATEIIRVADRAEQLISELQSVLSEMATIEADIWSALREAGTPTEGSRIGQKGLAGIALNRSASLINGKQFFRSDQRTVVTIARTAWSELLPDAVDADDI